MEIKVAICDDERQQTEYLRTLVTKWSDDNNIPIETDTFDSAESFKKTRKNYDILLLDIQMGGQNGVELAKELRETDDKLIIVFITAVSDFIDEGYEVSALHYLLKPVNENKLYATLDKAYKNITQDKKFLIVNSDNKDCRILFDDILYVEAIKHCVEIVTIDGKHYEVRQSIGSIEEQLDNSFFRCQRSFIVMLKHIKYISKKDVLLDSGITITLSRNVYQNLYRAFIKYFKGDENL